MARSHKFTLSFHARRRIFMETGRSPAMRKKQIKFEYDAEVDAAYLSLRPGRVAESEEVQPGLVVDFTSKGEIVGVEILNFRKRFNAQIPKRPQRAVAAAGA
jgi:uncharacterized protein YuzE